MSIAIFYSVVVISCLEECDVVTIAGKAFVDLGSGVGQVCMMIAALTHASSCFGIEIMPNPAEHAAKLLACFQKHRFSLAPIELVHGDFLTNQAAKDAVKSAGLVFMNNPKFGPELNGQVLRE